MKIIKEHRINKRLFEADDQELQSAEIKELEKDVDDGMEKDASVADLADAVAAEAELASNGQTTMPETNAERIAREIKAACADFDEATWAPLEIPHKFTKMLDKCLANARYYKYSGSSSGTDLLVTGLPGSGKTAIFKNWCKERGVKYKYLNVKDDDLSALINGFSVHEVEQIKDRKVHQIIQAGSRKLASLVETPTVLFLDEFNRADQKLRAQILTLVNEHQVAGYDPDDEDDTGFITLHGLLFTVACVNPSGSDFDSGAMSLNQAEKSRSVWKMDLDSEREDAYNYLRGYYNKRISRLDPKDPMYAYSYRREMRQRNLAIKLLGDPDFKFDDRESVNQVDIDDDTILNQRYITDAIAGTVGKADFLDWLDNRSEISNEKKSMIHKILDYWQEPDITVPTDGVPDDLLDKITNNTSPKQQAAMSDEERILQAIANGEETDVDLFTNTSNTATPGQQNAKVDASEMTNRIMSLDLSI